MGNRKAGTEEAVDPGLDAADAAAGPAPTLEEEPTAPQGVGEPPAEDGLDASLGAGQAGAEAVEPAAGKGGAGELSADPRTEPQALEGAEDPGGPEAHERANDPAVIEAEPHALVDVEVPAPVCAEPKGPMDLEEPVAVDAAEAQTPRARHRKLRRRTVGRFLRRGTITMGAAALVALVWYLASSAVVFSRPSPVDGPQPAGAEQLDDRVIVRKMHVPAATSRMGGASAPVNQAVGDTQPASGHAPSSGASGVSPTSKSSPMPTPTPTRPGD